jgi:SAM-dependent methyltransferase
VDRLQRLLGRRLLEVGCGVGTMTRYLCDRELVVAVDSSADNVQRVQRSLGTYPNLVALTLDITSPVEGLSQYRLDSALCSNVLEHVADDELALRRVASVLPVGGRLVVVVPAWSWLYGSLDVAAGHYRRYSLPDLRAKLGRAGFVEREAWWVNSVGMLGWFVNGRVLQRSRIPDWQIHLFDIFAQPLLAVESRLRPRFGLTLVVACEKGPSGPLTPFGS